MSSSFTVTTTSTLSALAAGFYELTTTPRAAADSIVSPLYGSSPRSSTVCVADGATRTANVQYALMTSSGKAWVGTGVNSLAFTSAQLATSATLAPSIVVNTAGSMGMTFDRDGNLWVATATNAGPALRRFRAGAITATAAPLADVELLISGMNCEGRSSLAFDEAGNLWVSSQCADRVVRLSPNQLNRSRTVPPLVVIGALDEPDGIAFDAAGDLWVADGDHLRRYAAARLTASTTAAADLSVAFTLPVSSDPNDFTLSINQVAFDSSGVPWGSTYYQNAIFRIDLTAFPSTGQRNYTPTRINHLSSFAQPRGFTFDNGGGLLIAYQSGTIGRLSPAQLAASSIPSAPIVPARILTSSAMIPFADNVVIFPAPVGTPLYHRVR